MPRQRDEQPIGFFAVWKATDTWFAASQEEKRHFNERITAIFRKAKGKGVRSYGVFDCSWSSEWRYFTFWTAPDVETLEEVMAELAETGDINKYNEQRHFVGRQLPPTQTLGTEGQVISVD